MSKRIFLTVLIFCMVFSLYSCDEKKSEISDEKTVYTPYTGRTRYYTVEDFESIVVDVSTLKDIEKIVPLKNGVVGDRGLITAVPLVDDRWLEIVIQPFGDYKVWYIGETTFEETGLVKIDDDTYEFSLDDDTEKETENKPSLSEYFRNKTSG